MSQITRYKAQNQADLLRELVKTRFKLRYNNSILGFVWVLIKPLVNFLILYFIFTAFRGGVYDKNYAIELLLGIIIFTFINEGTIFGMNSLLDVANIILKINFPRYLAVTSSVFMALINFSINFVILIVLTFVLGQFNANLLSLVYFLAIICITYALINTISLYLSILLVKIRDLTNIMELFFQLLFWASAIFYGFNDIQGTTGDLIRTNPIAIIVDAARKAYVHGEITHVNAIVLTGLVILILYFLGRRFFAKNVTKIAEYF